jgi:membrane-bound serine protease (ClpP class)
LLFAIGLSLLIFEFFTAGIGIAGVVGAVCSMLGIYGLAALPIRGWAVAL